MEDLGELRKMRISWVVAVEIALYLISQVTVHLLIKIIISISIWIILVSGLLIILENRVDLLLHAVPGMVIVFHLLPELVGDLTEAIVDGCLISLDYLNVGVDLFGNLGGREIALGFQEI